MPVKLTEQRKRTRPYKLNKTLLKYKKLEVEERRLAWMFNKMCSANRNTHTHIHPHAVSDLQMAAANFFCKLFHYSNRGGGGKGKKKSLVRLCCS